MTRLLALAVLLALALLVIVARRNREVWASLDCPDEVQPPDPYTVSLASGSGSWRTVTRA